MKGGTCLSTDKTQTMRNVKNKYPIKEGILSDRVLLCIVEDKIPQIPDKN
jgi:hypothetical protein